MNLLRNARTTAMLAAPVALGAALALAVSVLPNASASTHPVAGAIARTIPIALCSGTSCPPPHIWVHVSGNSQPGYRVEILGKCFNNPESEDGVYFVLDGSSWGPDAVVYCHVGREDDTRQG